MAAAGSVKPELGDRGVTAPALGKVARMIPGEEPQWAERPACRNDISETQAKIAQRMENGIWPVS